MINGQPLPPAGVQAPSAMNSELSLELKPVDKERPQDTILVVDDDEAVRKAFALAFEDTPYQVETAESGEQGLEKETEHRYDLVFLDLKMPGLNGVQTLREIRKIDADVPVYIVTAFHVEYFEELKAASVDGISFEILQKPVGRDQLIQVTEAALEDLITQQ